MRRLAPAVIVAAFALTVPAVAVAAGPWTVSNPQGASYTSPGAGTVDVYITTTDGYPGRENVTQAYEFVVVRVNGVEVGRTVDLPDRVATASLSATFTFAVKPGDVVTIVHSSQVGLSDGTQNSVVPMIGWSFTPAPTTTTVAPATTSTTVTTIPATTTSTPTSSSTTVAPSPVVPTTTVEVGPPPVPTSTVVTIVAPPRTPIATSTTTPTLPDTGTGLTLSVLGMGVTAVGAFLLLVRRGGAE